jgi:hypothetical protein
MAFTLEGNDPNRQRDYPTPAEVRAMVTGQEAPEERAWSFDDDTGLTFIDAFRNGETRVNEQRCPTCGLLNLCWCQPNCEHCNNPHPNAGSRKEEVS